MSGWIEAVGQLRAAREAGVLATITQVRGHAPREAGAKMVVSARRTWATIGGGNLEEETIARARAMIEARALRPVTFTESLSDKAPAQHAVQCCGGTVTVLLEPLPVVPAVAVFGLGHVGLELARILARHDIDLHLVDSREAQVREAQAAVGDPVARVLARCVPLLPEQVLDDLPAGTDVLVLTHDHAEDFAIVDAALRRDHLGSIGLIGSTAKWARFRRHLSAAGLAAETIERVQTPLGLPGLSTSKEPAAIALSVAAAWLGAQEAAARLHAAAPLRVAGGPR